jgi:hypothetical protein
MDNLNPAAPAGFAGPRAIAAPGHLTGVMRLQGEYVQTQMRSLAEQAAEMSQIVGKAALDAAKPKT